MSIFQKKLAKLLNLSINNFPHYESNDYFLKSNGTNIQDREIISVLEKIDQLETKVRNILKGTIFGTGESYLKANL